MTVCKIVFFSGMHFCCAPPCWCTLLFYAWAALSAAGADHASCCPSMACPPPSSDWMRCSVLSEQPARLGWGLHSMHSSYCTPVTLLFSALLSPCEGLWQRHGARPAHKDCLCWMSALCSVLMPLLPVGPALEGEWEHRHLKHSVPWGILPLFLHSLFWLSSLPHGSCIPLPNP